MSSTARLLTGGSSNILYYDLSWDLGLSGATFVSYTVTALNTITVTGLTSGQEYEFKYRTQNVFGWGDYSPIMTMQAKDVPT